MRKVSCIIPAYNEEKRISSVLSSVIPLLATVLKEVIVVDDFSHDGTKEIVKKFSNVVLLEHEKNEGKSRTIADGIRYATGDYILMLDSDLIGLEENNVLNLTDPVLNHQADVTISYRGNTPRWWIYVFKVETFSGERCFPRRLLASHVTAIDALPGYGLEAFINQQIIANGLRIKSVPMHNVTIEFKWYRYGLWAGIWKEILMWKDIFSVVNPLRLTLQVFRMKKLAVSER